MTTYVSPLTGATYTEEFVNAPCTICGKPRLQCAQDLGEPYVKEEEDR